jgi:hypothetical protein
MRSRFPSPVPRPFGFDDIRSAGLQSCVLTDLDAMNADLETGATRLGAMSSGSGS